MLAASHTTPNIDLILFFIKSSAAMATIEIYSSPFCGSCFRAKQLLHNKNVAFIEIDVMMNASEKQKMTARSGGLATVPQILINDRHIGGCDDLYVLDRSGVLERLLSEDALEKQDL